MYSYPNTSNIRCLIMQYNQQIKFCMIYVIWHYLKYPGTMKIHNYLNKLTNKQIYNWYIEDIYTSFSHTDIYIYAIKY